jgi:hypothetical protein
MSDCFKSPVVPTIAAGGSAFREAGRGGGLGSGAANEAGGEETESEARDGLHGSKNDPSVLASSRVFTV